MRIRLAACRALVWTSVATTASLSATSSCVQAAEFSIVNASHVHLQHLYVSPCHARQWGPDQLAEPLAPSRLATVSNLPAGCYDIEFVVAPWNNCVIAGANLRRRTVWKVTQWTVFGSQSGDCSHIAGFVPTTPRPWAWPTDSAVAPIMRKD